MAQSPARTVGRLGGGTRISGNGCAHCQGHCALPGKHRFCPGGAKNREFAHVAGAGGQADAWAQFTCAERIIFRLARMLQALKARVRVLTLDREAREEREKRKGPPLFQAVRDRWFRRQIITAAAPMSTTETVAINVQK